MQSLESYILSLFFVKIYFSSVGFITKVTIFVINHLKIIVISELEIEFLHATTFTFNKKNICVSHLKSFFMEIYVYNRTLSIK